MSIVYESGVFPSVMFFLYKNRPVTLEVNSVFPFTIHDFFPTTGQLFYPVSVEMWGFGVQEVGEPFLELFVIIEGNATQIDSKRTEKVIIIWSEVSECASTSHPSS
ncbi:hypothetical protein M514_05818 [Trichuris suis]|uniref:Uncharacterized protein n=1 Tax=Trichuris suis TaxID=68888 RepID=A0A085M7Z1_9BILA|nr:hypothetical protein M513_05818 [Trichuris suis]KFD66431.1 hypothetical protein M514_05818 [Trichuris suis]